jgi:transposase-like protein
MRRTLSREFKVEAAKLIKERGVSLILASRNLDVHESGFTVRLVVVHPWASPESGAPNTKQERKVACRSESFPVYAGCVTAIRNQYADTSFSEAHASA